MKCSRCKTVRIGSNFISKHVKGVVESGKDPEKAAGYRNTIAVVKGLHRVCNEDKEPCSLCIKYYKDLIRKFKEK